MLHAIHTMTPDDIGRVLSLPFALLLVITATVILHKMGFDQPSKRQEAKLPAHPEVGYNFTYLSGRSSFAGNLAANLEMKAAHAITSENYKVPQHIHLIDLDRSRLCPSIDGTVLAHCCLQGCNCVVAIGRGVMELHIEDQAASNAK
jgi:hypothetical protein